MPPRRVQLRVADIVTPGEFIIKWRASQLKESAASQEHFIDLCRLLGEPTPAEADPTGDRYCFERGARKDTGGDGWADVWKRHCFAWEYKGKHADLGAAFNQLRQYALALENPPLLIVSDMVRFRSSGTDRTASLAFRPTCGARGVRRMPINHRALADTLLLAGLPTVPADASCWTMADGVARTIAVETSGAV